MICVASAASISFAADADGNVQHRAGLQPVHVVLDEGLRVAAPQRDQHLVERDAPARWPLGDA